MGSGNIRATRDAMTGGNSGVAKKDEIGGVGCSIDGIWIGHQV